MRDQSWVIEVAFLKIHLTDTSLFGGNDSIKIVTGNLNLAFTSQFHLNFSRILVQVILISEVNLFANIQNLFVYKKKIFLMRNAIEKNTCLRKCVCVYIF